MRQIFVDKGRVDYIVFKDVLHRVSKWTGLHVVQHCCGDDVRSQPKQVSAAVEGELSALPGTNRPWQDLANNAQDAATDVIKQGYKEAQGAFKQALGSSAPEIPSSAMRVLDQRLAALAKEYPNTSMGGLVEDVRKALRVQGGPAGKTEAPGLVDQFGKPLADKPENVKYLTDALHVKQAINDNISTYGSRALNSTGQDPQLMRTAQQIRKLFDATLDQHAPNLSAANRAYNAVMEGTVDPLKNSVIGRIAGRNGPDDTVEASKAALQRVFEKGTTRKHQNYLKNYYRTSSEKSISDLVSFLFSIEPCN